MAQPRHRSARPEHGPGRDRQWQRKRHGMVRRECGAELEQTRPERHAASAAQREAGSEQCGARISIRTGTQRDRRSAQRGRDATGAARHSRHTARCECGAAPARTSTGSARHKNGLARARCSVERAQTARHSAQRGRDGAKRNRLGAAQSMRRSPDQMASMSHFAARHLFKKCVLIEQPRR